MNNGQSQNLSNATALVTGAAKRIGRQTAMSLTMLVTNLFCITGSQSVMRCRRTRCKAPL